MMKKIGNAIVNTLCVLSVIFMLWLGASWVDIIADKCHPNPVHSEYNAFVILCDVLNEAKNN